MKYEAYQATTRRKRGWQVMEHDGTEDGRLVAGDLTDADCELIVRLLNIEHCASLPVSEQ